MDEVILTPREASKQNVSINEEAQAKFRDLHSQMVKAIEATQAINAELATKLSETETLKASAESTNNDAIKKLSEIDQKIEGLTNREENIKIEEDRLAKLQLDLTHQDEVIGKQRDELQLKEAELTETRKQLEIDQREVLLERKKVERLAKDKQVQEELARG